MLYHEVQKIRTEENTTTKQKTSSCCYLVLILFPLPEVVNGDYPLSVIYHTHKDQNFRAQDIRYTASLFNTLT